MSSFIKSLIRHMRSKSRKTKKVSPEVQRLAKIADISYKKGAKESKSENYNIVLVYDHKTDHPIKLLIDLHYTQFALI